MNFENANTGIKAKESKVNSLKNVNVLSFLKACTVLSFEQKHTAKY